MKTFKEFVEFYNSRFENPYLVDYVNQMLLDDQVNEANITIEIEKFLILKRSDDILDKGLGWSCSSLLTYMMEDWETYQEIGETFFTFF